MLLRCAKERSVEGRDICYTSAYITVLYSVRRDDCYELMGWGSISIQFNGHFSRWIWVSRYQNVSILDLLELRMMQVVVTTVAIICKAPVKLSPPTNQHNFLQTWCPSCHPTNSVKALCPRPHRVEAFSNDACLTSICLSNVCLSRTLGLNREQSQWAGSLLSAARPLATCRGGGGILWRPPALLG